MNKTIGGKVIVDGYASGVVDFASQLAQSAPEVQQAFDSEILQPMLAVLGTSDESCTLLVFGHADRVDTPGLTREEIRVQELEASNQRAVDVIAAVNSMIADARGELPPELDRQQVAFVDIGLGATRLRESGLQLAEDQRQRNRRVDLFLVRFTP